MIIEVAFAFLFGLLIGHLTKPKNVDFEEQKAIYDKKVIQYEIEIAYYKQLCKWHVERNRNGNA